MEQKDYLLREIEKIGKMLRMFLDKINLRKQGEATTFFEQEQEVTGWLSEETGFDLDRFLALQETEEEAYLQGLNGLNTPNLELLGDLLMVLGTSGTESYGEKYLSGAKRLYSQCEKMDRSYSMDRHEKMNRLDILLDHPPPGSKEE